MYRPVPCTLGRSLKMAAINADLNTGNSDDGTSWCMMNPGVVHCTQPHTHTKKKTTHNCGHSCDWVRIGATWVALTSIQMTSPTRSLCPSANWESNVNKIRMRRLPTSMIKMIVRMRNQTYTIANILSLTYNVFTDSYWSAVVLNWSSSNGCSFERSKISVLIGRNFHSSDI
jgi:hypothetical protein